MCARYIHSPNQSWPDFLKLKFPFVASVNFGNVSAVFLSPSIVPFQFLSSSKAKLLAEERKKTRNDFFLMKKKKENKTITVLCVICFASRVGSLSELRV